MSHLDRVRVELTELKEKTTALAKFLNTDTFNVLSDTDKALLVLQFKHMRHYCSCLELRLA